MPTMAIPPQQPMGFVIATAQGNEGKQLLQVTERVRQHWRNRSDLLGTGELETGELETGELDDLSFTSVPLRATKTISVKYRYIGKLRPRQLTSDELD